MPRRFYLPRTSGTVPPRSLRFPRKFGDDANVSGNVVIKNFTSDDLIHVTHAAAADYSFAVSASDPTDLEITFNNGPAHNTIILDGVLPPQAFVTDYQSAAQALGAAFITFG